MHHIRTSVIFWQRPLNFATTGSRIFLIAATERVRPESHPNISLTYSPHSQAQRHRVGIIAARVALVLAAHFHPLALSLLYQLH
jgi:hypothetical protein